MKGKELGILNIKHWQAFKSVPTIAGLHSLAITVIVVTGSRIMREHRQVFSKKTQSIIFGHISDYAGTYYCCGGEEDMHACIF